MAVSSFDTVEVTYLSEIKPEKIEWYWQGRMAKGKVGAWDGDPGLGKTTAGLDIAARFSRGDVLPGETKPVPKMVVGILSDEDGIADTTIPRLQLANADLTQICQLIGRTATGLKRSLTIPNDIAEIIKIVQRDQIGYLHIDPLAAHASVNISIYNDQEVRTMIMGPLAALAEETGACVTLVRHLTKQPGMPAMYRGGGSIGVIGAARFGLLFGRDPGDKDGATIAIASTKANIGPAPPTLLFKLNGVAGSDHARVWWDPVPSHLSADDLAAPPTKPGQKALTGAQQWLLEFLMPRPRLVADVYAHGKEAGHSERSLDRAKGALNIQHQKAGFGGSPMFWLLPTQTLPQAVSTEPVSAESIRLGDEFRNGDPPEHDRWT